MNTSAELYPGALRGALRLALCLLALTSCVEPTEEPVELCLQPGDEDQNGKVNIDDPACADRPERTLLESCQGGKDEDGDGDIDCADSECVADPACLKEDCVADGDEDQDGLINCADPDCRDATAPQRCAMAQSSRCAMSAPFVCQGGESFAQCGDGLDNDYDGSLDCDDADCQGANVCSPKQELCNAKDDDMDGVIDEGCGCTTFSGGSQGVCALSLIDDLGQCKPPPSYSAAVDVCGDNLDDDCDGVVDDGCPCDYQGINEGVCRDGLTQSNGTCSRPTGYAQTESGPALCADGLDNNCDGRIDTADRGCP